MKVLTSKHFEQKFTKYLNKNPQHKKLLTNKLDLLRRNIKYPSLRLHKLKTTDTYSISINMSIRIIFSIVNETIYLLDIGTHDEVY